MRDLHTLGVLSQYVYDWSDSESVSLRYMYIPRGWIQPSGPLSSFPAGCRQAEGGPVPNPLAKLVTIVEGLLARYRPWPGDPPIGQQA